MEAFTSFRVNSFVQATVSLVAKEVLKSVLIVDDLPTPETPTKPITGGRRLIS
jgi:hypothetical protein